MAIESAGTVVERLRRIAGAQTTDQLDDRGLLQRFVAERDEGAFALLVRSHGPMVLAVCERLLGNRADAEDAFQATFIVLVRKADSIRGNVAGFLHAVAWRAALEARTQRSRRQHREVHVETLPDVPVLSDADTSEIRGLIDDELNRLPEKYRSVVVLCELEGRPRADAARQLGIPEGTLSSRLALARRKLAASLRRRGVELPVIGLGLAVPQAGIGAQLMEGTLRAAAGKSTASTVQPIVQGVLHAMFSLKLKLAVVLMLPLLGASALVIAAMNGTEERGPAPRLYAAAAEEKQKDSDPKPKAVAQVKTVSDARPVVVKTVPQAGSEEVDASVKEIRVTFSKDMMDQSWSWSGADEGDTPKVSGKPHYDKDKRTCVLPVTLEAGKTYAYWINSQRFTNFKDADGRSAVPYLLVFQTKAK